MHHKSGSGLQPQTRHGLHRCLRFRRQLASSHHAGTTGGRRTGAAESHCIAGARCCPPEDVGGTSDYENFLSVLFAPAPEDNDEQRHLKRWSGRKFDPERFDLTKTDKKVRRAILPTARTSAQRFDLELVIR